MSRYQIFDNFVDSVFVLDAEGRVHYGNGGASILLEVSSKRLTAGRPFAQYMTFDPDPFSGKWQDVSEATQIREITFQLASGYGGSAQVTVQPEPADWTEERETKDKRWILYFRDVSLEKTLATKYRGELDQKEAMISDLRDAREKLEQYSKNLEGMVAERTAELSDTNHLLKTILDSLGQGILVFDKDGRCLPVFSQVCKRLLESDPTDNTIEQVLHLKGTDEDNFAKWREAVFEELLDFRDMVPLAPQTFRHSAGLEIALDYHPMRDADDKLFGIVLVATDRTMEMQALRKAQKEREMVGKVTQVARNREAFRGFVLDSRKLLEQLRKPESLDLTEVAHRLHTLKGAAASFSLQSIAAACHELEDDLKKLKGGDRGNFNRKVASQADKVMATLDKELSMLSELLGPIGVDNQVQMVEIPLTQLRQWSQALIKGVTLEKAQEVGIQILKETSEKSVSQAIQHLGPSLVELAASMGKRLGAFEINNGDLKLPAHFAQGLMASLVHAFRNAVYHGLEEPAHRKALGKSEAGSIRIHFDKIEGDRTRPWLSIRIEDDGRGINPDAIRAKLVKKGLEQLAMAPDDQVIQVILRDDFSTAEEVNAVAGRGVGLGAIASEARRLGGSVVVRSVPGHGMTLEIHVPYPRGTQNSDSGSGSGGNQSSSSGGTQAA